MSPTPSEETPRDESFPKELRLRAPAEFQCVYQHRRSVSDDLLLLYARPNELGHPRFGVSVSKKIGGAVERNRWRRLLKEAFRLTRPQSPTGLDLIAIPRVKEPPTLERLKDSLQKLLRRAEKRART